MATYLWFPLSLDRTYNLGGAYRLVMSKPSDVKWKFVRYDNPTLNLIPSDWDRLENTQLPPAVVEGIIPRINGVMLLCFSFVYFCCRNVTEGSVHIHLGTIFPPPFPF